MAFYSMLIDAASMRVAAAAAVAFAASACAGWGAGRAEPLPGLDSPRGLAFANVAHGQARLPWHFSSEVEPAWRALPDAAVVQAPTVTPDGRVYVTSGRGVGHAHLHAYASDGELLWEAEPMAGMDDLDHGAVLSSPLVDRAGNVYVADANQVWSFDSAGAVRWASVDFERLDVAGQLIAPRFVRIGDRVAVGGASSSGELLLFERDTGGLLMEVHRFPGRPMADLGAPPEGLWLDTGARTPRWLIAEDYAPTLWALLSGSGQRIRHPLAVSHASGRLFVLVAAERQGQSRLYGVDVALRRKADGIARVAFARNVSGVRPVGPVVSLDGRRVYVIGSFGLQAIDADSGRELWRHRAHRGVELPVAGYDGALYTVEDGADGSAQITAIDGPSGRVLWRRSAARLLARELLAHRWQGARTAAVDSRPVLASDALWMVVNLGWRIGLGSAQRSALPYPARSVAVALDRKDGSLRQMFPLQLTFSGQLVPGPDDGAMYVASDAVRDTVNFARSLGIPRDLRAFPRPVAGVGAYLPRNRQQLAWEGLREVSALLERLQAALSAQVADRTLARSLSAMAWLQYDISARVTDETIDVVVATGSELGELHERVMGKDKPDKLGERVESLRTAVGRIAALYNPAAAP